MTEQNRNRRSNVLEPHEPAQIRWLASLGIAQNKIARFFEVSVSTVHSVVAGKTWAVAP